MAVRRGWRVDGLEQIQMLNDARWSEVIKVLNQLGDVRVGNHARSLRVNMHAHWFGNANRV